MARRITQKQLKHDEFVDAAFDFGYWMEENWPVVLKWVGAAAVVVVAFVGWRAYSASSLQRTRTTLAAAVAQYDRAQAAGFADPQGLNGALETFRSIAGEDSAPARSARFYEGATLYRLGRLDEAVATLEPLVSSSEEQDTLAATAQMLLAQVHATAGRHDEATSLLQSLSNAAAPVIPPDLVLLELARMQLAADRTPAAQETLRRITLEYPQGAAVQEARALLEE